MRRHLHPLVCASLLACALPTLAADIGSASIGVNNLSIRLIDLDAEDGITPGITVADGTTFATDLIRHLPANNVYADPFQFISQIDGSLNLPYTVPGSWTPYSASSTDGSRTLNISPDSLSAQATLSTDQLSTATVSQHYDYGSGGTVDETYTSTVGGGQVTIDTASNQSFASFTLTANTSMVIEGSIQASTWLDAAFMRDYMLSHPDVPPQEGSVVTTQRTASLLNIASAIRFWVIPTEGDAQGMELHLTRLLDGRALADGVDIYTEASVQPFSYTVNNATSQDLTLFLALNGAASVTQSIVTEDVIYTVSPSVVPEPATYALMGLGLVGITLVRRRRA